MKRDASFRSEGADLAAWLYLPDATPPWPLVIMAHGYSATRGMVTDRFAEVFRDHGLAALLYDHRGFGASGGDVRQQINPWIQARGYRDALRFAATLDDVDSDRVALWGDSLSGEVALAVAAVDDRVAALVVQVPAFGDDPLPDPDGAQFRAFRETLLSGNVEPSGSDEVAAPLPVVSDNQIHRPSALLPITAFRWFTEYGKGKGWINEITSARPKTQVPWRPSPCPAHVSCPSLFVVAPDDEMEGADPGVARDAWEKLTCAKKWMEIRGGHFGLLHFPSSEFERASLAQAEFLSRHLIENFIHTPPDPRNERGTIT
ncbi:MAG TPA: alpha/beta fold hydrolase [Gammaproteobacteria bacterium]|nr:alpha/beta fold hydrolase [Gammaproteobacteria bacterium]